MSVGARRVAVVTGASSGIGRASAALLAQRGWGVAAVDVDPEPLQSLCAADVDVLPLRADVTDGASIGDAVAAALHHFDRIDCVFANAAVMAYGTVLETTLDEWKRILDVNLNGVYTTIRACLPAILDGEEASSSRRHRTRRSAPLRTLLRMSRRNTQWWD